MRKEIKMSVRTKHNPIEKAGTYHLKVVDAGLCKVPVKGYKDPSKVFKIFLEQIGGDYTFTDSHALQGYYKLITDVELPERLCGRTVRTCKFEPQELEVLDSLTYSKAEFAKMTLNERKTIFYTRPTVEFGESYVVDRKGNRLLNQANTDACESAFFGRMARIYGVDLEQCVEGAPIEDDCKVIKDQLVGKEVILIIEQNTRTGFWEVKAKGKEHQIA